MEYYCNANLFLQGHTVTIKLKTVDFVVRSRALTLSRPMSTCHELYNVARQLLQQEVRACQPRPLALRLMGKSVMLFCQGFYLGYYSLQVFEYHP